VADTPKKSDMLTYVGGATVREITGEQFKAAGVDNQDTVQFTPGNRSIKVGDMTREAVELLLQSPEEFRIDSDKTPAPNGE
jgi:hypothetical protein